MRSSIWLVVLAAAACGGGDATDPTPGPTADGTPAPPAPPNATPPNAPPGTPAPAPPPPPPPGGTYDQDGTTPYDTTTMSVTGASKAFDVTVWMPKTAGPHPVVSFSCGTNQTAAGYAPYAKRLASYGIASVLRDDPGVLTNTGDIWPDSVYVVSTWMPTALAGKVDLTKVGLSGHSRGGGVSLLVAENLKGKVAAWFGLDPVDNEFGQAPREYARTNMASIGIPTAFLGAGVTSNCAPTADSYSMLYPKSPSPSVLIVGTGAGHTQLEPADACSLCNICSPNGTADSKVVLAYAVRYLTAFFARELLGDKSVGPTFAGVGSAADVAASRVTISSK
jgi:hypothetical protein